MKQSKIDRIVKPLTSKTLPRRDCIDFDFRRSTFDVPHPRGAILMFSLVFLGLFVVIGVGLVSMIEMQRKLTVKKVSYDQALHIAEAGLNYYRWHLAHAPNDFTDGTNQPGPYIHSYTDPYGSTIGAFALTISSESCVIQMQETLLAVAMDKHCNCEIENESRLNSSVDMNGPDREGNAYLATTYSFPATANYTFTLLSEGNEPGSKPAPIVELLIDGISIARVVVGHDDWRDDVFSGSVVMGIHEVRLVFVNAGSANDVEIASLTIHAESIQGGGQLESIGNTITITSEGWTLQNPQTKRKVRAVYARQSLAQYAFLTNENVWFGEGEIISGPVHANGGIRMDGSHNSTVSSARETYICDSRHGCHPNQSKPGVWGSGGNPHLWSYPSPVVDFAHVTADLTKLKSIAQAQGLFYSHLGLGYHVTFLPDGKFSVYRVKRLQNPVTYYDGERNQRRSWDIHSEELIETKTIPSGCGIIFFEDHVWVDGVVNGKVTLVAAKLPENPSSHKSIIINGNIVSAARDGSSTLGLIAQDSVIIPLYAAPDNLEVHAALMAQKGSVVRYHYTTALSPYHLRHSITLYGTIISNKFWTWTWVDGNGRVSSGYQTTKTIYNSSLAHHPPPGFPKQGEYSIIRWEDVTEK